MADEIGFIQRLEKGRSHGVAALDEQGIITASQLPQVFLYPQAEVDEDILLGQPVYLKHNGHLGKASADDPMRSCVVGIALSDTSLGHVCSYTNFGSVQREDWTCVAPDVLLKTAQTYYLDAITGKITNIPPASGYLVEIGRAVNNSAIALNITQSILL